MVADLGTEALKESENLEGWTLAGIGHVLLVGKTHDQYLATPHRLTLTVESVLHLLGHSSRHLDVYFTGKLDESGRYSVLPSPPGEVERDRSGCSVHPSPARG